MPHHAAPAAADVEQPHARAQVELAGDQVVLGLLRLLQGRLGRGVAGTGVGHRLAQHHLVEPVRDVVVVVDRRRVAPAGVQQPVDHPAPVGQRLLRRRGWRHEPGHPECAGHPGQGERVGTTPVQALGHRHQQRVGIAGMDAHQVHVARHICAGHPERSRCRRQVGHAAGGVHVQAEFGVLRPRAAAVVGTEPEGDRGVGELVDHIGQTHRAGVGAGPPGDQGGCHGPLPQCHTVTTRIRDGRLLNESVDTLRAG